MTETERLRQAVWFADEHARGVPGHTPQRYEDAGGLVQYRCDTCQFDTGVTWDEFCSRGRGECLPVRSQHPAPCHP